MTLPHHSTSALTCLRIFSPQPKRQHSLKHSLLNILNMPQAPHWTLVVENKIKVSIMITPLYLTWYYWSSESSFLPCSSLTPAPCCSLTLFPFRSFLQHLTPLVPPSVSLRVFAHKERKTFCGCRASTTTIVLWVWDVKINTWHNFRFCRQAFIPLSHTVYIALSRGGQASKSRKLITCNSMA